MAEAARGAAAHAKLRRGPAARLARRAPGLYWGGMIRMRLHICLAVLSLALAACVAPGGGTDRVRILGGTMTIAAPQGYCVDPGSRRDTGGGAFVLFGSCAAISGDPSAAKPPYPAMLSATVGPTTPEPLRETFPGFEKFFQSSAGRAALARSGAPQDVAILRVVRSDGLLLLKIRDRSRQQGTPVSETYWRAITGLGGRITALSVLPLRGARLSDAQQIRLLHDFDAAIRAANRTGL